MTPATKYRPDIDGLRAIAVLAVVLFHFKLGPFQGGFVGVDIFFVISGFLIAGILQSEMDRGIFTLTGFYERRIRRILPALGVVLLATALAGVAILLPTDLRWLGDSVIATALFGSNIYFWRNTGYFDPGHDFSPLLHTWSLAVEEQFYVLFPLLLYGLTKLRPTARGPVIAGLGLASFGICVIVQDYRPEAVFYLLPFRMWELLAGAWLAVGRVPELKAPLVREAMAITGLSLIGAGVLLITPGKHFPGWVASVPVLGTMLVIYTGSGGAGLVTRLLSVRPLVGIGLISYSLYLWHWPVIVLARYRAGGQTDIRTTLVLLAIVLALSYLTYRHIETPIRRRGGHAFSKRRTIVTATLAMTSGVTLGLLLWAGNGWNTRFAPDVVALDKDRIADIPFMACNDRRNFYEATSEIDSLDSLCQIGTKGGTISAILWGDSHALAWAPAIDAAFRERGITGVLATRAECPPLTGLVDRRDPRCGEFNEQVNHLVSSHREIQLVVLGAVWPSYVLPADPDRLRPRSDPYGRWDFTHIFEQTIGKLDSNKKRVWVLGPTPRAPEDPAFGLALAKAYDIAAPAPISAVTVKATDQAFWQAISQLSPRENVVYSDPGTWLCNQADCRYTHDGLVLYRDAGHLNIRGAMHLLPDLLADLAKLTGDAGHPAD
jgi:peptidoglycan/LPS O-acetylase OafA/YrhL